MRRFAKLLSVFTALTLVSMMSVADAKSTKISSSAPAIECWWTPQGWVCIP